MKLETKQTEVRLVAESDIDSYYLDNFFDVSIPLYVTKSYGVINDDEVVFVSLSTTKQEWNESN